MLDVILLAIRIGVIGIMLCATIRLRKILELIPLYIFIGTCFVCADFYANLAALTFLDRFEYTAGSASLFVVVLMALLIIYEFEGPKNTRNFVYGICISKISIVIFNLLFSYTIEYTFSESSITDYYTITRILAAQPRVTLFSLIAFFFDVFLIVFIYNYLKMKWARKPVIFYYLTSMLITLYVDSIIFVIGAFYGRLDVFQIIRTHIAVKTVSALLYYPFFSIAISGKTTE